MATREGEAETAPLIPPTAAVSPPIKRCQSPPPPSDPEFTHTPIGAHNYFGQSSSSSRRSRSSASQSGGRCTVINSQHNDCEDQELQYIDPPPSSDAKEAGKFMSCFFRPLIIIGTVLIYAAVVVAVGWANKIPSVQLDFTHATTAQDFFNPHTLKLRTNCGSNIRSSGGFEVKNVALGSENDDDADPCWDQYDTSKKWVSGETRKWVGWIHPGPMMSNLGLIVQVRGQIDVTLTIDDLPDGPVSCVVNGKRAETINSVALDDVNLQNGKVGFEMDVHFRTSNFDENDLVALLYYAPGPMGASKEDNAENAALLPFSTYIEPKQLTKIAAQIPRQAVDETDVRVSSPRGIKFVQPAAVFFWTFLSGIVCLIACIFYDIKNACRKEAAEFSYVKSAFDWRSIVRFAPAAILWGLADISEVLALGKLEPVIYAVLLQQRLVGTAIVSMLALKRRYTTLQWTVLIILVLLVIAFSIGGAADSGEGEITVGALMFTMGKIWGSVLGGVWGEMMLQKIPRPFICQWVSVVVVSAPCTLVPLLFEPADDRMSVYKYGIFGGFDFGWDARTIIMIIIYTVFTLVPTFCSKVYSALVKNVCNAVSLLVLYLADLVIYQKSVEPQKLVLTIAVASTVALYAMAKDFERVVKKAIPIDAGLESTKTA